VNAANDFRVEIPVAGGGSGIVFSRDEYQLVLTPTAGDYSNPVVVGNAVLFNSVFDGVDVQYSLVGSMVKEDIVVSRPVVVPTFSYRVSVGEGLVLDGSVECLLVARTGSGSDGVVFSLSAPGMWDAAGGFSDAVTMRVDPGLFDVSIVVDQGWVDDPVRVFPIRIDPTVNVASSVISLIGVEQGAPDTHVGDNGFPYAGFDDGIISRNIAAFDRAHWMTRTYVWVDYDFSSMMGEARVDSARFVLEPKTNWSAGRSVFDL
jgi:hypothetical protein